MLSSIELLNLKLPQPAGSVLISPWIDMSLSAYKGGNALVETDFLVTANQFVPFVTETWLGGLDGNSPYANPLCYEPNQLYGLNQQLIFVGGAEFAIQDSRNLSQLLGKAHVPHELHVGWGEMHIYAMGSDWVAPSVQRQTDAAIIVWILDAIEGKSAHSQGVDFTGKPLAPVVEWSIYAVKCRSELSRRSSIDACDVIMADRVPSPWF